MRFTLDGLDVFFPYDYLYKEQYDYMLHLKKALDERGHFLLEMPTGTGKTVCLIALITSYQYQFPQTGKLIYCTRTVPEMYKCMEEIRKVINYRTKLLGPEGGKVLALCLSSRRNMCINSRVMEEGDREAVDSLCRNMTASWVRSRAYGVQRGEKITSSHSPATNYTLCDFYEKYDREGAEAEIPRGVYSLDDLKEFGQQRGWCPYFTTRRYIHHANILVYNYQYILDPRVSNIISRELESESIVVFDEAHNIDNVCIEALSVIVDKKLIDTSIRNVQQLQQKVGQVKASNQEALNQSYQDLMRGLQEYHQTSTTTAASSSASTSDVQPQASSSSSSQANDHSSTLARFADAFPANPALLQSVANETMPGNIRKADHFLIYLKKIILYLRTLLSNKDVEKRRPLEFIRALEQATGLERKALKHTHSRLNTLLRTLEITALDDFISLQQVSNFATLVSTYLEGFAVIVEPTGSVIAGVTEPLVHLACLDASIAIRPVFDRFQSVIITSGTLSPIDFYPKLLNFKPILRVSLPMSTFRPCLLPLIVTRGSDQIAISTRFELRKDIAVIRNYGHLLLDVVSSVPDGVCCFFTSYQYMEYIISIWDKMNILSQVMEHKLIYLETKDVVETTLALENYRRACDCGRGAVFFSIARGKVAEGIDFDRHYGRCVLLFGIPYQYTLSHVLKARLEFMMENYQIRDADFLTFDALRQSAQCIGRVIRSKTDYGIVILADARYQRADKKSKFPPWVLQFLRETGVNISTDVAIDQMRQFLKQVGQPIEDSDLRRILLDETEVAELDRQQQYSFDGIIRTPKANPIPSNVSGTPGYLKAKVFVSSSRFPEEEEEQDLLHAQDMAVLLEQEQQELEQQEEEEEQQRGREKQRRLEARGGAEEVSGESGPLDLSRLEIPSVSIDKASKFSSLFLFADE